ncbi:MAG: carbohydrate kinase [Caldilineaceae bacterium]|nr:carbohydrate kinase [Caldilineaceae bacterium]
MASPLTLTLDIGSSSTRALVFDHRATCVPGLVAQVPNAPIIDRQGDTTFDATAIWSNVLTVIDQIMDAAAHRAADIKTVACCTFVTNILGVRRDGTPVTPVLTYANPSAAADVALLREELGPAGVDHVHDRTGCLLHSSYLPARFRWIERTHPAWLAEADRWMSIGEYVLWRFTGQRLASYSVATWTGLLNRRTLDWDGRWLERLPVRREQLSPLGDVQPVAATLQAEWAARWPDLASARWLPAIGDGAAANVGSGCADGRHIALTIGTTGAMRVVVPPALPAMPDGLWLYRVTQDQGLLGGATTEGGNLLAWLRETLRLPPLEPLDQAVQALEPAGNGLTFLPFISGERAPGWNDSAHAVLAGFNPSTTPVAIYRAALEAIAYRFALIFRRMEPYLPGDPQARRIVASGGALTGSPAWLQIMADVLNCPVDVLAEQELSARGLALVALQETGIISALDALPPTVMRTYQPDPARHLRYRAGLDEQVALYARLFSTGLAP